MSRSLDHGDADRDPSPHGEGQRGAWIGREAETGWVSVIVPTYNRHHLIGATLQSVINQTYRPIEIVVVDDGSTDDTRTLIDEFSSKAATQQLAIKYVFQENAGAPAARNRGTRTARGEFLQYLDSDDLLDDNKVELQVTALRSADWAAFAYGPIRELENPARTIYCQTEMSWERMVRKSIVGSAMQTAGPLYRRTMIASIGPWDESIVQADDWEYFSRIVVTGFYGIYCPDAVTLHRIDVPDRLRWSGKPGAVETYVRDRIAQLDSVLAHASERARMLPGFFDMVAWNLLFLGAFGVANAWSGDERRLYERAGRIARSPLPGIVAQTSRMLSSRHTRAIVAAALLAARWVYYRTIFKLFPQRV